ncbi:MAG: 2-oxoglutarate and iron-dependent oxygenase domain-containing protein, partial [Ilumatobacter sp.]
MTSSPSTHAAEVVLVDGYVPVIDISSSLGGDLPRRQAVAAAIADACAASGFFVITGHGVSADLVERMERVCLEFFALPSDVKEQYAVASGDVTIRGFYGTPSYVAASNDVETAPDLCQLYTVCRLGEPGVATVESLGERDFDTWSKPNVWPTEVAEFKATWWEYYTVLETLSAHLMRLFALGLDLDEEYFDDKIDDHIPNLTVNYYPSV